MLSENENRRVIPDALALHQIVANQSSIPFLFDLKLVNSKLASIVKAVSRTNIITLSLKWKQNVYWKQGEPPECRLYLMGRRRCADKNGKFLQELLAYNGDLQKNLEQIFAQFPTIRLFDVSNDSRPYSEAINESEVDYIEQSITDALKAHPVAVRGLKLNRQNQAWVNTKISGACLIHLCSQTLRKLKFEVNSGSSNEIVRFFHQASECCHLTSFTLIKMRAKVNFDEIRSSLSLCLQQMTNLRRVQLDINTHSQLPADWISTLSEPSAAEIIAKLDEIALKSVHCLITNCSPAVKVHLKRVMRALPAHGILKLSPFDVCLFAGINAGCSALQMLLRLSNEMERQIKTQFLENRVGELTEMVTLAKEDAKFTDLIMFDNLLVHRKAVIHFTREFSLVWKERLLEDDLIEWDCVGTLSDTEDRITVSLADGNTVTMSKRILRLL